jgi:putative ABC transport system permease protein
MRGLGLLALKSAWARRLTLGIVLAAIVLASMVLLAVERLRSDAKASFAQSIAGVDLVVGARSSPIQLMLYAVFRSGSATQNMSMTRFDQWAQHPSVAWAIPLSLGDSHQGFPVLGTTPTYFTHLRYGAQQSLALAQGRAFGNTLDSVFETVLGANVAAELGYQLGDQITLSHGLSIHGPEHSDKPFKVVGILAATGTPVDRSVHVSLEAITAIHLDWVGGAPLPGLRIAPEQARKFNLRPTHITAMLVGLQHRPDVFQLQRLIQNDTTEPLMAVMPGIALDELWQTVGMVENILFLVSALVVLMGLSGLCATMLAGLNERRRELAILRTLGASPRDALLMLLAEGAVITSLGVVLGYALLHGLVEWLRPVLQSQWGITLLPRAPSEAEYLIMLGILLAGVLVSLLPGWRAWRLSLADGLNPPH